MPNCWLTEVQQNPNSKQASDFSRGCFINSEGLVRAELVIFIIFYKNDSTFRLGWQEFFTVGGVGLSSGVQLPAAVLSIFFIAASFFTSRWLSLLTPVGSHLDIDGNILDASPNKMSRALHVLNLQNKNTSKTQIPLMFKYMSWHIIYSTVWLYSYQM